MGSYELPIIVGRKLRDGEAKKMQLEKTLVELSDQLRLIDGERFEIEAKLAIEKQAKESAISDTLAERKKVAELEAKLREAEAKSDKFEAEVSDLRLKNDELQSACVLTPLKCSRKQVV